MSAFCNEVRASIANYLAEIDARYLREEELGGGTACLFAVGDRLIAITDAPYDGQNCRVSAPNPQPPLNPADWDTLWSTMGLTRNTDTDEGLTAYLRLFPDDGYEFMQFMGKCLLKYFHSEARQ